MAQRAYDKFIVKEWQVPDKKMRLPKIFPINEQTAFREIKHDFKVLLEFNKSCYDPDTLANNVKDFVLGKHYDLIVFLGTYLPSEEPSDRAQFFVGAAKVGAFFAYGYVFFTQAIDLAALLRISTLYHGMDYVIASYDMHLKGEVGITEEERQEKERKQLEDYQNAIDNSLPNQIESDNGISNFFLYPSSLR